MARMSKTSFLAAAAVLGLALLAGVEAKAQGFAGSISAGGDHGMMSRTFSTPTPPPTAGFGMMSWPSATSAIPATGPAPAAGFQETHDTMWDFMEAVWH
ncbi:MAG: hypothetical protein AAGU21_19265 [Solidesulfovibrio sp.]|uniref:hypothetical protein n=1 Tax=Solidesulfovibrio sp. TaxID=2910990 RepID=UPI002B2115BA|nr:hypothetical protein [Solidesulfovibrio sp.]MEA4855400.1 hypothetical protein [Solidesulfovibrio sp.]